MSKLDEIKVLQQELEQLEQSMSGLSSNVKKWITDEDFIEEVQIQQIQQQLEQVRIEQQQFLSKYELLQIGLLPSKLSDAKAQLEQCQKRIEDIAQYVEVVEFFNQLHSKDETVQNLLLQKQEQLNRFDLETMEIEEIQKQLQSYVWIFQAFYETDPRKKFSLIYKLFPYLEEELAMELQFGTLCIREEIIEEEIVVEEEVTEEEIVEEITEEEIVEEEVAEDIWSQIDIENPEDVIVKEDTSLLHWSMSDKASTKFGVKEFKKDMQKQPTWLKVDCLTFALTCCGYTDEMIETIRNKEKGVYASTTEKLYKLGYLKQYAVDGFGEFYVLSPRGEQAFRSREAIAFVNSQLSQRENLYYDTYNEEESEEQTNAALTRILCYDSYARWHVLKPKYEFVERRIRLSNNYFTVEFKKGYDEKVVVFLGITSENPDEFEDFYEMIKEDYDEETVFVVAGVGREQAHHVAKWIAKLTESKLPIWYYAYHETETYDLATGEIIQICKQEEEVVVEESIEDEIIAEEELEEEEVTEEVVEEEVIEEVVVEEEEVVFVEVEEEVPETTEDNLLMDILSDLTATSDVAVSDDDTETKSHTQCYQELLASNKLYCATTYVKALAKKMPEYESMYRQIAYAVNDPMEACSYNSNTVYDIYYNAPCTLSDHYVVSATMRNYYLDQFSYDYSLQQLHSMISGSEVLRNNPAIDSLIYQLLQFKAEYHVGIDKYADYREKERGLWEQRVEENHKDAVLNYNNYILGNIKETKLNRRFMEMAKMLLAPDDDLGLYLQVVIQNDKERLEELRAFLTDKYIKADAEICEENIDPAKIDVVLEEYWELSTEKMHSVKKSSDLMSSLRMNLFRRVNTIVGIMANYVFLMDSAQKREDTQILYAYKKIRNSLLSDIEQAKEQLESTTDRTLENIAGNAVLMATLKDLEARLKGDYVEGSNKYFYIDFLKNDKVLLDDSFMPILDEVLELPDLSIWNRIMEHAKEEEMDWSNRLSSIFSGEDDYGSAQLILTYLNHKKIVLEDLEKWNVEQAVIYPQKDAEIKRNSFLEELELAQSYGKIDNTIEDSKETMVQIMDTWFAWANDTMNYGFFAKILQAFYDKIAKDAQVRAVELNKNLKVYLEQNPTWNENDLVCKTIHQIQDRIAKQNYAAAEDLMNRLVNEDLEVNVEWIQKDYLAEFFDEYEGNYHKIANTSATLKTLLQTNKMNKDIKGASRLIENWPKGAGVRADAMKVFLDALGFRIDTLVSEEPIQGKMDCFFVKCKRPENGRKSNYKHPISAFGSEAEDKGFRIVCMFGKTDASRLIDIFKEIGNAKNTIVLLDYALTLADRRTLARKTKTDLTGKIFAVMDRVVLVYLAKHYVDTAVNRMLMSIIMPFASYQPYIDKSADVMPQELFIGRKNELEKIESPTGVNIVYGGRQLGKTALLRMAKKDIDRNENGDRAVIVSVWGKDYKESAKIISQALYDEGILKTEHVTEDWNELSRDIKNRLRDEQDKIPYLLLMIDEADVFIESCESIGYAPFEALKDIQSIGSGRFKFVVAGLRNIVRFKKEAALGNNRGLTHLDSLTVKPFKTTEARELLEVPLSYLGFRFPKNSETEVLISTIFGTTNYFPGLIQLYCTKLIEAVQRNYAGYDESETPPYIVQKEHIKKVLAEQTLQQDIREKFFITLKVGDDDYYYIIALLVAYHYHQNKAENGCSAKDLLILAEEYSIQKLLVMTEEQIWALMEEMCELNVLQHTETKRYRFSRHSFCQMMGTVQQIDDELYKYMED